MRWRRLVTSSMKSPRSRQRAWSSWAGVRHVGCSNSVPGATPLGLLSISGLYQIGLGTAKRAREFAQRSEPGLDPSHLDINDR